MLFFALGLVMAARAGIARDASHAAVSPAALRTVVVRAQWLIDGIAQPGIEGCRGGRAAPREHVGQIVIAHAAAHDQHTLFA